MALETNEFFSSVSRSGPVGVIPHEGGVKPVTFDGDGAGTLLAPGTPVAFDSATSLWVLWDSTGLNDEDTIRGFVYPDEIQLHATDEVVGQILQRGEIDYASIVLPAGEVEADLKAALRVGPRTLGLVIDNLSEVH